MKGFVLFCLLALVPLAAGFSETLYVVAKVCPVQAEPVAGSKRVVTLPQGAELTVKSRNGDWVQIQAKQGNGWVRTMFVGASAAASKVTTTSDIQNLSTVVQRRRASSFTTSAAAARGLSGSDVRARENLAFADYDFASLTWVRGLGVNDGDVAAFTVQVGLQPAGTVLD